MSQQIEIKENVSLSEMTTFKIGGVARYFIAAKDEKEIASAVEYAKRYDLDVFILGGGSNILIADEGFPGLVIQICLKGVSIADKNRETVHVTAKAGEDWDEFVKFCVGNGYAGIECLSGIPGFVGGTPIQNVGAYGQEVSETIVAVDVFDRVDMQRKSIDNVDCGFQYRKSIFNTTERGRYIVLAVTYALRPNGTPKLVYKDLKEHFAGREPGLHEFREAVCKIRRSKGMLVRQGGPDSQSAGSFFKNPIIKVSTLKKLEEVSLSEDLGDVPRYSVNEESIKIPAAWLIEKAGFEKGFSNGNVGLSTRHTLALTNRGGATASELLQFMELIKNGVQNKFGIKLQPEPNLIGFDN